MERLLTPPNGAMDCARARAVIWPPDQPKLVRANLVAAREHVDACASCRAHFEIDRMLEEARHGLLMNAAPRAIRERVFEAVARRRSGRGIDQARRRRPFALVAIALIVASLFGAGLVTYIAHNTSTDRRLETAFVDDYVRLAVREDHVVTPDTAEVRRFLMRELGRSIAPLTAPGVRIAGAEVCLLRGRRGAMISYETRAGKLSYYLVPRPGAPERPPAVSRSTSTRGTTLVTWVSDGIERALVGPQPPERLLALARGGEQ